MYSESWDDYFLTPRPPKMFNPKKLLTVGTAFLTACALAKLFISFA